MKRDFRKILSLWKRHPLRKPLIVRGARQVGKTFIIEVFGREEFANLVTLNFEVDSAYQGCFESMDPYVIVGQIELLTQQKIVPGETLLFLAEIQLCPKALQSLRYFKEQLNELHVIAAGSLLEFAIQEEDFSFPVGRVQFAKLYPLSFGEFLDSNGDSSLREALHTYDVSQPPPPAIHEHMLNIDPQHPGLMVGPLAEQFVGQEILAISDPLLDEHLFFWTREKVGSSAEVDYIISYENTVFPIEVKAGKAGRLKSLQVFLQEKRAHFGIKISQEPLSWDDHILTIPFYLIEHIYRLIASLMPR